MDQLDAYIELENGQFGKMSNIADRLEDIVGNYQDVDFCKRHHVKRWWIVDSHGQTILGEQPENWFFDSPVYENDTGQRDRIHM